MGSGCRWGGSSSSSPGPRVGRPRSADRRSLLAGEGCGRSGVNGHLRRAKSEGAGKVGGGTSDGIPSDGTEDDWGSGSRGSGDDLDMDLDLPLTEPTVRGLRRNCMDRGSHGDHCMRDADITELDRRVQQVARMAQRQCQCKGGKCSKLKVRKLGEGKYSIAGRNVFI
ncbi:hypothetical protein J437_LFUL005107, partial [Ladona fulva]